MHLPAFLLLYYLLRCNPVRNTLNFSLPKTVFRKLTTHSTFWPNVVVLVVFYPKNYIPFEQKAFEKASSWFYPVRQPFVKRQQRGDTKYTRPLKNHFISFNIFKCREVYHPFNVNNIDWSDSDCYIWQMQRGHCVLDKALIRNIHKQEHDMASCNAYTNTTSSHAICYWAHVSAVSVPRLGERSMHCALPKTSIIRAFQAAWDRRMGKEICEYILLVYHIVYYQYIVLHRNINSSSISPTWLPSLYAFFSL